MTAQGAFVFSDKRAVLFDLDGTLVHSAPDLVRSANEMLRYFDLPEHSADTIQSFVGNGAARFVERALTGDHDGMPSRELFQRAFPVFRDYYRKNICVESRLYDGVIDVLDELTQMGLRMGCVTNKAEQFTLPLLDQLGIDQYFDVTVSGDTLERRKPDPEPLLHACIQLGVETGHTLMVGDTRNDIDAAAAIPMDSLFVRYGYGTVEGLPDSRPSAEVSHFTELVPMLRS